MAKYDVISADAHVETSPAEWTRRMPEPTQVEARGERRRQEKSSKGPPPLAPQRSAASP